MISKFFIFIFIFIKITFLASCASELSDVLGTNKLPPDEFTILT